MTLAIIPAAGFGTRMNMAPDQSKEMLIDSTGKPVIQWCLDRCRDADISPLVVTRKEKKDLIQYLQDNSVPHMVIKPEGEWMDTVLATSPHWQYQNLLFLPDIRFTNTFVIHKLLANLDDLEIDLCIGTHEVTDCIKWGMVNDQIDCLAEKPSSWNTNTAWGLLAFKPLAGQRILRKFKEKGITFKHNFSVYSLGEFKDITRSGKLE